MKIFPILPNLAFVCHFKIHQHLVFDASLIHYYHQHSSLGRSSTQLKGMPSRKINFGQVIFKSALARKISAGYVTCSVEFYILSILTAKISFIFSLQIVNIFFGQVETGFDLPDKVSLARRITAGDVTLSVGTHIVNINSINFNFCHIQVTNCQHFFGQVETCLIICYTFYVVICSTLFFVLRCYLLYVVLIILGVEYFYF